jgi:hypothetical protein
MKSVVKDWQKTGLKEEAVALPKDMNLKASIKVITTGKSVNAQRVKFRTTALKIAVADNLTSLYT